MELSFQTAAKAAVANSDCKKEKAKEQQKKALEKADQKAKGTKTKTPMT